MAHRQLGHIPSPPPSPYPSPPSPSPYPPPPPPHPPPPSPPDLSFKIEATFSFAIAAILLLVVVAIGMGIMYTKIVALYDRIPQKTSTAPASEATPETEEAMAKQVKVELEAMPASKAMPVTAKLAHVLAALVSGVIALAVSSVLADGTSVIKLKEPRYLPIATNPELKPLGLNHRLDELLGPSYGVGLHHDQAGFTWTQDHAGSTLKELVHTLGTHVVIAALPSVISTDDLKHPVPFLKCDDLQMAGLAAMSFGFIAEVVAVLMVLFHALALAGVLPSKIAKPAAALVWLTLTSGFLIVILLAVGVYTATWTCDNTFIPTIKLSDHFEYNYGFAFAIVGFLSSLLIFCVTLAFTSTTDDEGKGPSASLAKLVGMVLAGVTVGVVVATAASFIVLAGNDAWADAPPVDPNYNYCADMKPYHAGPHDSYFDNVDCMHESVTATLEQAGANVTKGYIGGMDVHDRVPITKHYSETDLCPVNVHWHWGAEHLSEGEYDEHGYGPVSDSHDDHHRQMGELMLLGRRCYHYDAHDPKFKDDYQWEFCKDMKIGETYEVHWPHSAAGACGTDWQYQSPFYDGVFCKDGIITIAPLNTYEKIGVQGQVFTIVNSDEAEYQYDNLIEGMWVDSTHGADMAYYTGSTTGTSRDAGTTCSRYTPITWQVDRKCHMISARSFDILCRDMLDKKDDMSGDVHPHGAREVVLDHLVANNQQTRK